MVMNPRSWPMYKNFEKNGKNTRKMAAILNFVNFLLLVIIMPHVIMVYIGTSTLKLCMNRIYSRKYEKMTKFDFWWRPFCLCKLGTVHPNFFPGNIIFLKVGTHVVILVPRFLCHGGGGVHGDPSRPITYGNKPRDPDSLTNIIHWQS